MTDSRPHGRYVPTTTHAEWGAGRPHLLVSREEGWFRYEITDELVRIGSSAENELQLTEIDPHHARITHDARDDYVLTMLGPGEMNANPHMTETTDDHSEILRTGARFTAGPWALVFVRDEFADHGRPYGGRQGGELSDQPSQPARPDYLHPDHVDWPRRFEKPVD